MDIFPEIIVYWQTFIYLLLNSAKFFHFKAQLTNNQMMTAGEMFPSPSGTPRSGVPS